MNLHMYFYTLFAVQKMIFLLRFHSYITHFQETKLFKLYDYQSCSK